MDPDDARCRDDQVQQCASAVSAGSYEGYANAGECRSQSYDIYDQLCTVTTYTPGLDYCCCPHAQKALCCRFHFSHSYFRCDEEEDLIALPLSLTNTIIISAVACVLLIVIIVVATKCYRVRRTEGSNCCQRCGGSPVNDAAQTKIDVTSEQQPLNDVPPSTSVDSNNADHRLQPSAPLNDYDVHFHLPSYDRAISEPAELQPLPETLHGSDHPLYRRESENEEGRRRGECPPPGYDEHHEHRRLDFPEVDGLRRECFQRY